MYQNNFGTKQQIKFKNESEYYHDLGFLAKSDGSIKIKWEHNDILGTAWGKEGRIEFFISNPNMLGEYIHTAGNGGSILSRVNCNEFIKNLNLNHHFIIGNRQDIDAIFETIPDDFKDNFNDGLSS